MCIQESSTKSLFILLIFRVLSSGLFLQQRNGKLSQRYRTLENACMHVEICLHILDPHNESLVLIYGEKHMYHKIDWIEPEP